MRTIPADVAGSESYELAEGPFWEADRERLSWVDLPQGRVLVGRIRDGRVEVSGEHRMPGQVATAVVPTADDGLLVALRDRFATLTSNGVVRIGRAVLPDYEDSRFNDGACDPVGRFLVGSMSLDGRKGSERLYRLDDAGGVAVVDDGFTLSNGLGWAPDGRTLYHVDSVPGLIWSRAYDPDSGTVGPRRLHLRIAGGLPDGLCVDRAGNLWVAVWGAGEVRCFDAFGQHVATVAVAAPHTSSVAFVGAALDHLLITTARKDLSAEQLAAAPLSGHLFLAAVGVTGVPCAAWAGTCEDIT